MTKTKIFSLVRRTFAVFSEALLVGSTICEIIAKLAIKIGLHLRPTMTTTKVFKLVRRNFAIVSKALQIGLIFGYFSAGFGLYLRPVILELPSRAALWIILAGMMVRSMTHSGISVVHVCMTPCVTMHAPV